MYRFFVDLLEPFTIAFVIVLAGAIYLCRHKELPRRRKLALGIPLGLLTLLCTPIAAHLALATLESQFPPASEPPPADRTIVVLSGYAFRPNERHQDTLLGLDSQWRCLHAVRLYQAGERPKIVVCGGKVETDDEGESLAALMRDYLVKQGVAPEDILLEERSRDTYENAVYAREILDALGIHHIVLVTQASHLPRAVRCFRGRGFDVTPSGCDYKTGELHWWNLLVWLPRPEAAQGTNTAFHEWLGLFLYWVRARL